MWDALIITPFVNVIMFIYNLVGHNFALSIVLFTILIRLVTHPLMVQQIKGSQGLQNLQKDKRWLDMQEKYKNDKEKLAQEQTKLYKEMGINPFGACLPTLIQFPIIIGLYQSLIKAMAATPVELVGLVRHIYPSWLDIASIIPLNNHFLWMNLGQPERLYLPFLPTFGIPVLAVLVVITTYTQSKLITPPPSSPNDQSAMMGNMMNIYMPFLMGWLAYTLASGLALYFVVSNLIGILQYAMLGKVNWSNLIPKFALPAKTEDSKRLVKSDKSNKN